MKFNEKMLQCYFVAGTQDVGQSKENLLKIISDALKAGITAFQFREKDASTLNQSEKIELGHEIKNLCQKYQTPLFVDDDLALAKAIHADGIHVGQSDMQIEKVLASVGGKMLIGYSCNTVDEIKYANSLDVDYIGVGPIFPTNSKKDADPVVGIEKLSQLTKLSKHPVVAIGGIELNNVKEVASSYCAGVAMISALTQSSSLFDDVRQIKMVFE